MQLDTTETRIMESRGSRHTLVISKVQSHDFGNYTCVADNQLGKTRKSIQLTGKIYCSTDNVSFSETDRCCFPGKPKAAVFKSSTLGNFRESYNISWEIESLSPIDEYQLLFRKVTDKFSGGETEHFQPVHDENFKKYVIRNVSL